MLSSKQWNNKTSDIKLVCLYSTIKMMHGSINIRFICTAVVLTVAKIILRLFSALAFALICELFTFLHDLYFLPAAFCDKILRVRNFGSHTQIMKQDETQAVYLFCGWTRLTVYWLDETSLLKTEVGINFIFRFMSYLDKNTARVE